MMRHDCKLGSRQTPLGRSVSAPKRAPILIATQMETETTLTRSKQTPRPISNRYTSEGAGL